MSDEPDDLLAGSSHTAIEWAQRTRNVFVGCTKCSPGCKFCYAIKDAIRIARLPKYEGIARKVGPGNYNWTGRINFDPDVLDEPYHWSPCVVFVNSMSDLFHEDVPFEWIRLIFRVMNDRPRHIFIILTKRSDILPKIADKLNWTPNIWIGVSVENAEYLYRIDDLRCVPTPNRLVSFEPVHGRIENMNLTGIKWAIVGGLHGGDAAKHPQNTELAEWIRIICDQVKVAGLALFFKQWGGRWGRKKVNGRLLDGVEWSEFPFDSPASTPTPPPPPQPDRPPAITPARVRPLTENMVRVLSVIPDDGSTIAEREIYAVLWSAEGIGSALRALRRRGVIEDTGGAWRKVSAEQPSSGELSAEALNNPIIAEVVAELRQEDAKQSDEPYIPTNRRIPINRLREIETVAGAFGWSNIGSQRLGRQLRADFIIRSRDLGLPISTALMHIDCELWESYAGRSFDDIRARHDKSEDESKDDAPDDAGIAGDYIVTLRDTEA